MNNMIAALRAIFPLLLLVVLSPACANVSEISKSKDWNFDSIKSSADGFLMFELTVSSQTVNEHVYVCCFVWQREKEIDITAGYDLAKTTIKIIEIDEAQSLWLNLIMADLLDGETLNQIGSVSTNPSLWRVYWSDSEFSPEIREFKEQNLFDPPIYRPVVREQLALSPDSFQSEAIKQNLKYSHLGYKIREIIGENCATENWLQMMFSE